MGKKALSYQTFTTAPRCEWEHHTTKASPCGDEPPQAQCAPAPPTGRAPKPFPCFAKGKEKTVKPRVARGKPHILASIHTQFPRKNPPYRMAAGREGFFIFGVWE
jgi:hypothetical protein